MKIDNILRDISLRAIAFLVILITLWAIVLLAGVPKSIGRGLE